MAMAFVGLTAIIMVLRHSLGGALSRFDTLVPLWLYSALLGTWPPFNQNGETQ